ncbi:hypothetical protein TorRG33x02_082040, partial [Trema orientale]
MNIYIYICVCVCVYKKIMNNLRVTKQNPIRLSVLQVCVSVILVSYQRFKSYAYIFLSLKFFWVLGMKEKGNEQNRGISMIACFRKRESLERERERERVMRANLH